MSSIGLSQTNLVEAKDQLIAALSKLHKDKGD